MSGVPGAIDSAHASAEHALGPSATAGDVVGRAMAHVAGSGGIQSTTQEGSSLAKTPQLNAELYSIPMADQLLAIVSVGGPSQHTKADSCRLRIAGFFASQSAVAEHGADLPKGNYMVVDSAVAYTFGQKQFANQEEESAYIKRVFAAWDAQVRARGSEFDAYVQARSAITAEKEAEEKAMDAAEKQLFKSQKASRQATAEALARAAEQAAEDAKALDKKQLARPLKGHHAVADQSWAAVSLLYDLEEEHLPIKTQWVFVLYGAFPSAQIARGHISDTVQHARPNMKHYAVKMYKWIQPDIVRTAKFKQATKGIFKFDQQNQLWEGAQGQKDKVADYKRKRQQAEDNMMASQEAQAARPSIAALLQAQAAQDDLADRTTPAGSSASSGASSYNAAPSAEPSAAPNTEPITAPMTEPITAPMTEPVAESSTKLAAD